MNSKPFNRDDVEIIKHFIERLPPPVCIVAHNGNKFDFPILQNHLHKLNCVSSVSLLLYNFSSTLIILFLTLKSACAKKIKLNTKLNILL